MPEQAGLQVALTHLPIATSQRWSEGHEPLVQTQVPAWQYGVVPLHGAAQGMLTQVLLDTSHS